MSQYSRFIRPGYHKINCVSTVQRNIYQTAYTDGSSKVTIVVVNTGSNPVVQTFDVADNGAMSACTPYTTSQSKNCVQGDDIAVVNGQFTATLEPSSITTFVSK